MDTSILSAYPELDTTNTWDVIYLRDNGWEFVTPPVAIPPTNSGVIVSDTCECGRLMRKAWLGKDGLYKVVMLCDCGNVVLA